MPVSNLAHHPQPAPRALHAAGARVPDCGAAAAALSGLLAMATDLDDVDAPAMADVQATGHRLTSQLVAAGALAPHLRVERDDPPIVALRTLAAAVRHVTRA